MPYAARAVFSCTITAYDKRKRAKQVSDVAVFGTNTHRVERIVGAKSQLGLVKFQRGP